MDTITKVRRNIFLSPALDARLQERARTIGVRPNALLVMLLDQGLSQSSSATAFAYHTSYPPQALNVSRPKKKTLTFGYTPPDYTMQEDGSGEEMPPDAKPLAWAVVQRVGAYLESDPDATPRTIAQHLGLPMWQATVGKQAFDTEWYGNQLEEIQRRKKKKG